MVRTLLHGGHEHEETPEDTTTPLVLKIVSIFLIFALCVVFTLIPKRLGHTSVNQQKFLWIANCFSGGVFLGFAMLHILPEAVEAWDRGISNEKANMFPMPYIMCLIGFFLVLAVEKIMYVQIMKRDQQSMVTEEKITLPHVCNSGCSNGGTCCEANTASPDASGNSGHSHMHEGFHSHDVPFRTNSRVTPYVVAFSMCFHSVFEGLSLGLAKTVPTLVALIVGIAIHKTAEAFGMGTLFIKGNTPRKFWITLMLIFSLAVPLGVGIGLGLEAATTAQDIVYAISNGMAAGSFLYVTLLGVIVEEFSGFENLGVKYFLVVAGIVFMAIVVIVPDMVTG